MEHLGRCVYDGIYEPGHPEADEDGFRKDVIELVKELGATAIRYLAAISFPAIAGRMALVLVMSGRVALDLAWHSTETNQFGLHEMAEMAGKNRRQRAVGSRKSGYPWS